MHKMYISHLSEKKYAILDKNYDFQKKKYFRKYEQKPMADSNSLSAFTSLIFCEKQPNGLIQTFNLTEQLNCIQSGSKSISLSVVNYHKLRFM